MIDRAILAGDFAADRAEAYKDRSLEAAITCVVNELYYSSDNMEEFENTLIKLLYGEEVEND